jgi:galactokinase
MHWKIKFEVEMSLHITKFEKIFAKIYGTDKSVIDAQVNRYDQLLQKFNQQFDHSDLHFFSTPGRTEIGGNHTDHNNGRVLTAAVDLDSIAVAAPNDSKTVHFFSDGYEQPFVVDLNDLKVNQKENETTNSLIRGIAARFAELGYEIGGFNAYCSSNVLPGSGLSSSASIEVLIGTIFNYLFNHGKISSEEIALIGQYAENIYFGKPCGLMDQIACAVGGIISIDFKDPRNPQVTKINFDFSAHHYSLLVVDTGGSHADLTADYASVPEEMKRVANFFGFDNCRQISKDTFFSQIDKVRKKTGDRAVLRTFHFIEDNERVCNQMQALEKNEFKQFLALVNESGNSSFRWLQNVYSTNNVHEQGVPLALALTEKYISEIKEGACRVHGGGFAGTIQVFLPVDVVGRYIEMTEKVFGPEKVLVLSIRPEGTLYLNQYDI